MGDQICVRTGSWKFPNVRGTRYSFSIVVEDVKILSNDRYFGPILVSMVYVLHVRKWKHKKNTLRMETMGVIRTVMEWLCWVIVDVSDVNTITVQLTEGIQVFKAGIQQAISVLLRCGFTTFNPWSHHVCLVQSTLLWSCFQFFNCVQLFYVLLLLVSFTHVLSMFSSVFTPCLLLPLPSCVCP